MSKRKKSRSSRKRGESYRNVPSKVSTQEAVSITDAEIQGNDLVTEYRYVVDDLGRIGIIAAILIGVLVALSFFL